MEIQILHNTYLYILYVYKHKYYGHGNQIS